MDFGLPSNYIIGVTHNARLKVIFDVVVSCDVIFDIMPCCIVVVLQ